VELRGTVLLVTTAQAGNHSGFIKSPLLRNDNLLLFRPVKSAPIHFRLVRPLMPNRPQLLFLASFFISFISLFALSNFLSSKLREAGYDFSRLILIGIPQNPNKMTAATPAPSFLDLPQSVVAQLFALLLAVASSAFIYLKFARSGTSSISFRLAVFSLTPSP
jgi:hypothetical protein